MQTILSGNKYKISETLKQYTNKKIHKLNMLSDKITRINVIFSIDNFDHIAEANLFLPGESINATANANNMNGAIDALTEKLTKQLKKYKDKQSKQT